VPASQLNERLEQAMAGRPRALRGASLDRKSRGPAPEHRSPPPRLPPRDPAWRARLRSVAPHRFAAWFHPAHRHRATALALVHSDARLARTTPAENRPAQAGHDALLGRVCPLRLVRDSESHHRCAVLQVIAKLGTKTRMASSLSFWFSGSPMTSKTLQQTCATSMAHASRAVRQSVTKRRISAIAVQPENLDVGIRKLVYARLQGFDTINTDRSCSPM
jgi:hypothetical protein